jgi:hypothetical protein
MCAAMAATATAADGLLPLSNGAKQTNLVLFGVPGNACKSRLPWPLGSGDAAGITQGGATDGRYPTRAADLEAPLTAGPCSNSLHPTVGGSSVRTLIRCV